MSTLSKIVLIGASADNEDIYRYCLYTDKKKPVLQITKGFGSFRSGIPHFSSKGRVFPEFIYIENTTCMGSSDILQGCEELCKILVKACEDKELPMIVIEDTIADAAQPIFADKGFDTIRSDMLKWSGEMMSSGQPNA